MIVDIGWPNKLLWPNGSEGSRRAKSFAKKKARDDASWAAISARGVYGVPQCEGEIPVTLVVHAKPKGPLPDKDNCIAAVKVQLDAIAEQIGVNDRQFSAPQVLFKTPRNGRIFVHVGVASEPPLCHNESGPNDLLPRSKGPDHNRLAVGGD